VEGRVVVIVVPLCEIVGLYEGDVDDVGGQSRAGILLRACSGIHQLAATGSNKRLKC